MTELQQFFMKHIRNIKNNQLTCQECGCKLRGIHAEVAHILSKSIHPELATEDENILYLCGVGSENNCHAEFDRSLRKRSAMKVHQVAYDKVQPLKHKAKKVTNEYKFYYYGK